MKRIGANFRAATGVLLIFAISSCAWPEQGFFAAAGPLAEIQRWHFLFVTGLVAIVILPLFVALPIVLWRYRLKGGAGVYRPEWDFDWRYEVLIWGLPVVIVAILGIVLWQKAHQIDPYARIDPAGPPPIPVQAVALDWKWLFIYPQQGIASVNELVVPAGREVALTLTADGPMASMLVPRVGGQIYAMAGMETRLHLLAQQPGDYRGLNTQYTGQGFDRQHFTYRALSPQAYTAWMASARQAPPLDTAAYTRLSQPSSQSAPELFGKSPPGLFDAIVEKYHKPGLPMSSRPAKAGKVM